MKNLVKFYLLFSLVLGFMACDKNKDPQPEPTYSITGELINANNRLVRNATIELLDLNTGTATASGRTDSEGKYTLAGVKGGSYSLRFKAEGYEEKTRPLSLNANLSSQKDTIQGRANISGRIINSQTGLGLANASISFSFGSDTTATLAEMVATTNSSGSFSLSNAPSGTFVQVIRAIGFIPRVTPQINITNASNSLGNTVLVEALAVGQMRVVLTWGLNPGDLDSHFTGPNASGNSRFHMYFGNRIPNAEVNLDVDDTNGFGPETTTIKRFYTGTYRYSVHNYDNQGNRGGLEIFNSPAKVELYDHTGLRQTFVAPPFSGTSGNTWRVFELTATSAGVQIVPVNSYFNAASFGDTTVFLTTPNAKNVPAELSRDMDK
ncbi:MAG: carboxypeptidase regulatory-like domain-containing protein [Microscillaceae bacterium]|jgi:hypothetical protein|nr:carboxypeptidase regulatory-like domain-containing protein [Microscillaceae bacterium]